MLSKRTINNQSYCLNYDSSQKEICLINQSNNNENCLTAKFFHDTADGASLLSNFTYLSASHQNQTELVKLTTDMVSEYLSHSQDRCKLFCFPGEHKDEFLNSSDYRSSSIDRLMLRENKISADEKVFDCEMNIESLNNESVSSDDVLQIKYLLGQTYWAEDADEKYIQKALTHSVFLVMRDDNKKIIALVRYVTNNHFAYISDMVVDVDWRKKGIATALMQHLAKSIDGQYEFTALISAKEGDGKMAAAKLYGEKFGFVDYDAAHHRDIYFRYIRLAPSFTDKLSVSPHNLMFSPAANIQQPLQQQEYVTAALQTTIQNKTFTV